MNIVAEQQNQVIDLVRQWEMSVQRDGPRNINCGMLRRIGKTQALRELISQYRRNQGSARVYVLVPTQEMGNVYRDLGVTICSIQGSFAREICSNIALVFADEVPDAEIIIRNNFQSPTITFIAGFYSNDNAGPIVYNPSPSDREEILTTLHAPQFFDVSVISGQNPADTSWQNITDPAETEAFSVQLETKRRNNYIKEQMEKLKNNKLKFISRGNE